MVEMKKVQPGEVAYTHLKTKMDLLLSELGKRVEGGLVLRSAERYRTDVGANAPAPGKKEVYWFTFEVADGIVQVSICELEDFEEGPAPGD